MKGRNTEKKENYFSIPTISITVVIINTVL